MTETNSITAIQATKPVVAYARDDKNQPENKHKDNQVTSTENIVSQDQKSSEINVEDLNRYVTAINKISESEPPHMTFSIDEETGHAIIKMTQKSTGELVRQIPSEEFLKIARMIEESNGKLAEISGHLIEKDA